MAVSGVAFLAEHRGGGAALGVDEVEADARLPPGKLNLSCEKLIHPPPRGEDGFARAPPGWPRPRPVVVVRPAGLGGGAPARLHRPSRDPLRDDAAEPSSAPLDDVASPVVREVPRVAVVVRGLRADAAPEEDGTPTAPSVCPPRESPRMR